MGRIKGIEITDLSVGTGTEATQDNCVAVNVRFFLRRGDEVFFSPAFGPRLLIALWRRDCVAGLLKGIPGMRVGGLRQIVISPHLAYGETGIPGRIPANALLRCEVELVAIREHTALLSGLSSQSQVSESRPGAPRLDKKTRNASHLHPYTSSAYRSQLHQTQSDRAPECFFLKHIKSRSRS